MPAWPTRWSATRACPAARPGAPPAKPRSSPHSPGWPAPWPAGTSTPTRPRPSLAPTSGTRHVASWSRPLRAKEPTPPASEPRPLRSQPETRPPNSASCASTPTGSCGSTTTGTEWCALRGRSTPTAGPGSKPRSPPSPTACGARTSNSPRAGAAPPTNETSTPCARPHPSPGVRVPTTATGPQTYLTTRVRPRPNTKRLTARRPLHPSPGVRPPVAPAHAQGHIPARPQPRPNIKGLTARRSMHPSPGLRVPVTVRRAAPEPTARVPAASNLETAQESQRPTSTPTPKGANLREQQLKPSRPGPERLIPRPIPRRLELL